MDALRARFHAAELRRGDDEFAACVRQVIAFVEQPDQGLGLPLDIRGTAFQLRVWRALMMIPSGTTLSYSELAERLGQPRAVRAVASACAANTLAVVVPCHRVRRSDGTLASYRWGVERKRKLIEREASDAK